MRTPSPSPSRVVVALTAAVLAAACASSESPPQQQDAAASPDPQAVLRDLGEIVIVPTLSEFHVSAQALTTATRALCEAPDADRLTAARDAWRAARSPWKRSEAFAFGPVVDLRIDSAVDFWPIRLSSVQAELALDTPVPEDYVATLGDTLKGMPVMEYILFDTTDGGGDEALLARLTQADSTEGSRTCDYLVALAVDVELRAKYLYEAWDAGSGDFVGELARAGEDSTVYPERAMAISAVVNAFVQLVQQVEGDKLAAPLGLRDGGVPQPQAAETWRSDNSRQDILDNLAGVRSMYTTTYGGSSGASFQGAVAAIDPALNASILAQFDAAEAAVGAITVPLDQAVADTPNDVDTAFQASKELLRLMAVDMVNTLGVTLSFSDNDGD
ncbi:imelysin family protein [Haliangium sp.]|uniref:imelysin family protein n=1 Tax=Haliangium sp. TaxID=2663208 RepID=UPI003D0CA898